MKKIVFIVLLFAFLSAQAQYSPYVEPNSTVINNTGFRAATLRSTPLSRPVAIHSSIDLINKTVSPRFVVAKADMFISSWAEACGWTNAANNSSAAGQVASSRSGCNKYSESGANAGTWRVPTQRELMIIYLVRTELISSVVGYADFVVDGSTLYWSSSAYSNSQAWAMNFYNGIMYNRDKTEDSRVRCVRDL